MIAVCKWAEQSEAAVRKGLRAAVCGNLQGNEGAHPSVQSDTWAAFRIPLTCTGPTFKKVLACLEYSTASHQNGQEIEANCTPEG